jgi:hypothetical protein
MLEESAAQVALELPYHKPRQSAGYVGLLAKFWPVGRDDLVEDARLGPASTVPSGTRGIGHPGGGERSDGHRPIVEAASTVCLLATARAFSEKSVS